MTKLEVGDTVEIIEGVLKGFQAKVTKKGCGLLLLGERTSYCSSPERLKLIKKANEATHVYVVYMWGSGTVDGIYTTREAAETRAERLRILNEGIGVAVLRKTLKWV